MGFSPVTERTRSFFGRPRAIRTASGDRTASHAVERVTEIAGVDDPEVAAAVRAMTGIEAAYGAGDRAGALDRTARLLGLAAAPGGETTRPAPLRRVPTAELELRLATTHDAAADALARRDLADARFVAGTACDVLRAGTRVAVDALSGDARGIAAHAAALGARIRPHLYAERAFRQDELERRAGAYRAASSALYGRHLGNARGNADASPAAEAPDEERYARAARAAMPEHVHAAVLSDPVRLAPIPSGLSDVLYRAATAVRNRDIDPATP